MAEELIDSYSEENWTDYRNVNVLHPSPSIGYSAVGNCFTCGGTYSITSAKFFLLGFGSPTGNAHAVLYAMTGTYGSSGKPTGSALATSDDFDVSAINGGALNTFSFTGEEQYEMQADTKYCIVYENPTSGTIDTSNYVRAGWDTSGEHDGNTCRYANGWGALSTYDTLFYVYGEKVGGVEHTHSASDTMTISDSLSVAATYNVALDDTMGIGDSLATPVMQFNVALSDQMNISDSLAALKVLHHSASDTLAISDSLEAVLIEGEIVIVPRRKRGMPYGLKPARVVKVGRIGV